MLSFLLSAQCCVTSYTQQLRVNESHSNLLSGLWSTYPFGTASEMNAQVGIVGRDTLADNLLLDDTIASRCDHLDWMLQHLSAEASYHSRHRS